VLTFLKTGKWISLGGAILFASLFILHLAITPKDEGMTLIAAAIGCVWIHLLARRAIGRITK
jgi:hypothetical protein